MTTTNASVYGSCRDSGGLERTVLVNSLVMRNLMFVSVLPNHLDVVLSLLWSCFKAGEESLIQSDLIRVDVRIEANTNRHR